MYSAILVLHSLLRWVVIVAGLMAVVRAFGARQRQRTWTRADNRSGLLFVAALDLQLLVGLTLYLILSPLTRLAFDDFASAMRNTELRFWAVEHPFGMLVAVALAHVGRVRIRKSTNDARRHDLAAMFFLLALVALLVSSPWPGLPNGRPLVRW